MGWIWLPDADGWPPDKQTPPVPQPEVNLDKPVMPMGFAAQAALRRIERAARSRETNGNA